MREDAPPMIRPLTRRWLVQAVTELGNADPALDGDTGSTRTSSVVANAGWNAACAACKSARAAPVELIYAHSTQDNLHVMAVERVTN
jgi:hypothetical protein